MKSAFKLLLGEIVWLFLNVIVNHIPCWTIRKWIYKTFGMQIGKRCRIGWGTVINAPWKICLGNGVIINEFCLINGGGGIIIGDETSISTKSSIISVSHNLYSDSFDWQGKAIVIEDHCFIGANAIILQGTVLHSGCIVGAGAVAVGELDADSLYIGNPIRKKRFGSAQKHIN